MGQRVVALKRGRGGGAPLTNYDPKCGSKIQKYLFKVKFDTQTNLMGIFTFLIFDQKYPEMNITTVTFFQVSKVYLKSGDCGDVCFFCFVWKYPCLRKLFQKIKIVGLSWNLWPRLIQYVEFNDDFQFFIAFFGDIHFGLICGLINLF